MPDEDKVIELQNKNVRTDMVLTLEKFILTSSKLARDSGKLVKVAILHKDTTTVLYIEDRGLDGIRGEDFTGVINYENDL